MDVYDFKRVVQKAPVTGKVFSKASRLGSTLGSDTRLRTTAANFPAEAAKPARPPGRPERPLNAEPERQIREMEAGINAAIDASSLELRAGRALRGLEKAREAQQALKPYQRYLHANDLEDFLSHELVFAVGMNLAGMYEHNELFGEALAEYNKLLQTATGDTAFLVRVNIGNLFARQEKLGQAVKMYKMALDMAQSKFASVKLKIARNIAHCQVRLGEFGEAAQSYAQVLAKLPDLETAFNVLLCLYVARNAERLRRAFTDMLAVETYWRMPAGQSAPDGDDPLTAELLQRQTRAQRMVTAAAKLIAPVIADDVVAGFDWVIEALKVSPYGEVLSELEIARALVFVRRKNIDAAIGALKAFEKKDQRLMNRAAANLGFLYLLEGDLDNAERYTDLALAFDRYNARALVNKGNCFFHRAAFARAKDCFLEAIGVEADCVEALYNLAFVNKKVANYAEALVALEKLNSITKASPDVLFQLAAVHELAGDRRAALKWLDLLAATVPNDPSVHARLATLHALERDEAQACHHHTLSFRLLPTNIETIAWLGIYNVKAFNYERACYFFERAALVQPRDVKWKLMIASCNRRMEQLEKALAQYKAIQEEEPDDIESLRFIVQISLRLGLDAELYKERLQRAERELEAAEGGFVEFQAERFEPPAATEREARKEVEFEAEAGLDLPE